LDRLLKKNDILYLQFSPLLNLDIIRHVFTTRKGGFSSGRYSSLNLGSKTMDKPAVIDKNQKKIAELTGMNSKMWVCAEQVHSNKVYTVEKNFKNLNGNIKGVDALITNLPEVVLAIFTADCNPIYIVDPLHRACGLVHAGWRGTLDRIGMKTLYKMRNKFRTNPRDCMVVIGPSIGSCCYEVDEFVLEPLKNKFLSQWTNFITKADRRYYLDLKKLNKYQFQKAGVLEKNIYISRFCTCCREDLFFSYRASQGKTGRMAALLSIQQTE